ncbi:uncharacterized protein LOC110980335 [Acanthaster planci]|uniref:Uncharacterized protein LOC110980335 n=1 Tax=Acanthaster planci TaxID=133434 RepID=A0A8B7YHA2_ACAPL|nr:uncharacterized protein LOC110980335 [Acanthaster planci]
MTREQYLLLLINSYLVTLAAGSPCSLGQVVDPEMGGKLHWKLATRDPCTCSQIQLGGLNTQIVWSQALQPAVSFTDQEPPVHSSDAEDVGVSFGCDEKNKLQVITYQVSEADPVLTYELPSLLNCQLLMEEGYSITGVYRTVVPSFVDDQPVELYCDMATEPGGWTVVFRLQDNSVNFTRPLEDYNEGFGDLTGEFWLGNERMSRLIHGVEDSVVNFQWEIQVDLWGSPYGLEESLCAQPTLHYFARYSSVSIQSQEYTLVVSNYTGTSTAGDFLSSFNGGAFRVLEGGAGWWYKENKPVYLLTANECYNGERCYMKNAWESTVLQRIARFPCLCKSFESANFATNDKGRIVTALPECGNSSSEPEMPTPKQNGRGSLEIFLPMYEELDQNQQSVSTPPSTPNPHGSSTLNPGRYLYCQDFNNDGNTGYVLTRIYPSDLQGTNTGVAALCDMESDGSGWIVFQRSGYQGLSALQWDFDKTFEEYKNGFGSLRGNNFWWGNDHLANITQDGQWELRVDIWWQQTSTLGQAEEFRRATYASFGVSGPGYTLSVSGYQSSSNLSDVLSNLNGMEFSARDGGPQATCAEISGGGWWFDQCVDWQANLNGHTACVGNDCNSDRASSSKMKVRRVNK